MVKTAKTLEEFIKDYVSTKIAEGDITTYGDWILKHADAADSTGAYENAYAELHLGTEGYGRRGEALSSDGLSGGGYARYLGNKSRAEASRKMQSERKKAESKKTSDPNEGYKTYMQKHINTATELYNTELERAETEENRRNKRNESAIHRISKEGILDYDKAYKRAISLGVSPEDAEEVAKTGAFNARDTVKLKVLNQAIIRRFTNSQAYAYARELGLDDVEARAAAKVASDITQKILPHESEAFLDYLRDKENEIRNETE